MPLNDPTGEYAQSQTQPALTPMTPSPDNNANLDGAAALRMTEEEEAQLAAEIEAATRRQRIVENRLRLQQIQERTRALETGEIQISPTHDDPRPHQIGLGQRDHATSSLFELQLPKPDPPPRFEGKDRAQLNSWIRGCERFLDAPALTSNRDKTNFAKRYLGDTPLDFWERALRIIPAEDREGTATWNFMKQTMLNTLGNAWEREQVARARVRNARQGSHSPTELLNYLKTLWEDIDINTALDDGNEQHIHEFYAALSEGIRGRLELQPQKWTSLIALETIANQHFRVLHQPNRPGRGRAPLDDPGKEQPPNKRPRNEQTTKNGAALGRPRSRAPPPTTERRDGGNNPKEPSPEGCWVCGALDHFKANCPKRGEQGKVVP
jgi:hypothetical protein